MEQKIILNSDSTNTFSIKITKPIQTIDKDSKRTYVFNAMGLAKNDLFVKEEFVNRTKEFSINIKGNFKDEYLKVENNLDICIPINYDIYESYAISVNNGILYVDVFEIINDIPEIKRLDN